MITMCFGAEAVELQVHFDALVMPGEKGQERIVASDFDSIGVEQDANDIALHRLLKDFLKLWMDRWLATADHQHIELSVLTRETLVDILQDLLDRYHTGQAGRGA